MASFTINLSVVARDVWARAHETFPSALLPRPSANATPNLLREADRGRYWAERIGSLMPAASDQWWHVRAGTDTEATAGEVVAAIRDHGLPALRDHITSGA